MMMETRKTVVPKFFSFKGWTIVKKQRKVFKYKGIHDTNVASNNVK